MSGCMCVYLHSGKEFQNMSINIHIRPSARASRRLAVGHPNLIVIIMSHSPLGILFIQVRVDCYYLIHIYCPVFSPSTSSLRQTGQLDSHRLGNWEVDKIHSMIQSLVLLIYLVCYCSLLTQYNSIQYSTVQFSTVQYSTVQFSTVQYSKLQYDKILYGIVVQYITWNCSTVQYQI